MRAIAFLTLCALAGCMTVERGADHVRDFAKAHPVVTSVGASIVVSSALTTIAMHKAKRELQSEAAAAERGQ